LEAAKASGGAASSIRTAVTTDPKLLNKKLNDIDKSLD
jgi:hypothetical protein